MRRVRRSLAHHGGRVLLAALVVLSLLARAHVHADEPSARPPCQLCTVAHETPAAVAPLASVAPLLLVATLLLLATGRSVPARAPRTASRAPPASGVVGMMS